MTAWIVDREAEFGVVIGGEAGRSVREAAGDESVAALEFGGVLRENNAEVGLQQIILAESSEVRKVFWRCRRVRLR